MNRFNRTSRVHSLRQVLLAVPLAPLYLGVCEANAQENAAATEIEEVVVVGTAYQNRKAIDARRASDSVIDVVAATDLGRLPDFNIGEALRRLPGIGIQRDQAEARFVTVRALNASYNYTTIDSMSVAVPDRNGRRVFMDVMPASLADEIEVIKTFTPNLEGGAIGGIINVKTASAFDYPVNNLKINAEAGQYENDEGYRDVGPSGQADFFYSSRLNNDTWGFVLTGNYYKRDSTVPQVEFGGTRYFYDETGADAGQPDDPPYPGTGHAVPGERRGYWYHNDRERYGGMAKVEYRPTDQQSYFVRGFWNQATDDEARQTDLLRHSGRGVLVDQTATTGTLLEASSLRQQHYLGQFEFERSVWALSGGGDLEFGDDRRLSFKLNYTGSNFNNPENWAEWRLQGDVDGDGVDDNAFSYERRGDLYFFELLDPEANRNFDNFGANRRQFDDRELNEDIYEAKVDWSDQLGDSGAWSYSAGLSYRQIERDFDENRDRYEPTDLNDYTLAASGVLNENVCLQPPGFGAGQCLVVIDPDRATSSWQTHYDANPDQWELNDLERDDNRRDYELEERVAAAYLAFGYSTERSNLIFGVRYEDTTVDGTGRRNVSGIGWTDASNSGGYSDWLPSINYVYDIREDLKLTAAYSQSLGRPAFNDIAPVGESLNLSELELSRSNPDLEPRRSSNYDLGLDYYFDEGTSMLGANIFYKDIEDEIFRATFDETIEIDGEQEVVSVTQPVNNGETTEVVGLELQFVKTLDNVVEGLGVSGNATFLDTEFQVLMDDGSTHELVTMIGTPETSYNLALFYDSRKFSAKIAYNYQDFRASERIRTDREYRNRYDTEEEYVDLKMNYWVTDHLSVSFNALNLTDEGRGEILGFDQELPMVEAEFGRAFFFGVSYRN